MISSTYLYGGLDKETAGIQKALFLRKKMNARALLVELKPLYNLLDFSQKQLDLTMRVGKIHKAILFCQDQIDEANEVLNA